MAERYIDADRLINNLTRKIRTERSTIEIKKLICEIEENTVGERVTVEYQGWIDVKERLPDAGQYVLIRHIFNTMLGENGEYEGVTIGYYFKPRKGAPYFYYVGINNYGDTVRAHDMCPGNEFVTHWMPMPNAPWKEENRDEGEL